MMSENDIRSIRNVGLFMVPGFALMSYASVVEPMRAANLLAGRDLYRWRHVAAAGDRVAASSGISVDVDVRAGEPADFDAVIVCASGNPALFRDRTSLDWLRRLARRGVAIGGVSGGAYVLARAGLLEERRFTIHWEHAAAFAEEFPHLSLQRTLYEIDRDRLTAAGGTAALDMMHALIARDHGHALATEVNEWFLQTRVRTGSGPQRMSPRERYGVTSAPLLAALDLMERAIENPPTRDDIAAAAGVSVRQLERLFAQKLATTIAGHALRLRLERAETLLRETPLGVTEVAIACGFQSASHFSRAYKRQYGVPPRMTRMGA